MPWVWRKSLDERWVNFLRGREISKQKVIETLLFQIQHYLMDGFKSSWLRHNGKKAKKKKKLYRCSKLFQEKRNLCASWMTGFWNLTLVLACWKFCGNKTEYVHLQCRAVSLGAQHGRPVLPMSGPQPWGAPSQPQMRMYQWGKQWQLAACLHNWTVTSVP